MEREERAVQRDLLARRSAINREHVVVELTRRKEARTSRRGPTRPRYGSQPLADCGACIRSEGVCIRAHDGCATSCDECRRRKIKCMLPGTEPERPRKRPRAKKTLNYRIMSHDIPELESEAPEAPEAGPSGIQEAGPSGLQEVEMGGGAEEEQQRPFLPADTDRSTGAAWLSAHAESVTLSMEGVIRAQYREIRRLRETMEGLVEVMRGAVADHQAPRGQKRRREPDSENSSE